MHPKARPPATRLSKSQYECSPPFVINYANPCAAVNKPGLPHVNIELDWRSKGFRSLGKRRESWEGAYPDRAKPDSARPTSRRSISLLRHTSRARQSEATAARPSDSEVRRVSPVPFATTLLGPGRRRRGILSRQMVGPTKGSQSGASQHLISRDVSRTVSP